MSQIALAQAPVQSAGMPPSLEQKQVFVLGLIEDASVTKRIQSSRDEVAVRFYMSAKEAYSGALTAVSNHDFSSADRLFNEAMLAMGKARRKVPNVESLAARQHATYEKALERVASLESASHIHFVKLLPGNEAEDFPGLGVLELMEAAKARAAEEHWDEALQILGRAEQSMQLAMSRMLDFLLREDDRKFVTQAEEYAYELARNKNIGNLIPMAVARLSPTETEREAIESLAMQNQVALQQSDGYATSKDYEAALASLRTGTGFLRLALSAAGIVISINPGNM
ncbi:MAG: hypothetical protein HY306_12670 [Nitrosomonadales bacterium]|nr:hypothetical protein [Nitrosomonadales bacterium]